MQQQRLIIKNMSCHCCIKLVRKLFEDNAIKVDKIGLGEVYISFDPELVTLDQVHELLVKDDFEPVVDKDEQLVEKIKNAVVELVHHSTYNAMVRNSDFLVEKFNLSYQYISTLFSKQENITLEKFIILQKIEKVKELIQYGELTLSEIAFMMGYSSVQYLSTQFKNVTGLSVSEFKKDPVSYRMSVSDIQTDLTGIAEREETIFLK